MACYCSIMLNLLNFNYETDVVDGAIERSHTVERCLLLSFCLISLLKWPFVGFLNRSSRRAQRGLLLRRIQGSIDFVVVV